MVNFGYPYNDIVICKDSTDYLYQANECYFVRKFYLFSHLRNIKLYPKSSGHKFWRHVLTSDDINFKEFPSKNGRAFPTFWQMTCQAKLTEGRWDYINRFLQIGLETGNKKPFWKYLRVQKQEDFGISALKSYCKMFTDRKSISEILNTQFKSVFTKKTSSKIPELPGVTFPSIKDLKITEFGVFKLLDKIDVSKASGPDCIPGRILHNLARELAPVLHFIF